MSSNTSGDPNVTGAMDAIAVIAMNGRFPGADNVAQLWSNLCGGKESITFFSEQELLAAGIDEQLLRNPSYVRARGVVRGVEDFDPSFFGLSPNEASYTDPQQRLFLESAWEIFEQAGYDLDCYSGSVGVFAGTPISSYLLNNLWQNPTLSADPFQLVLANDKDHLTTRAAYKLNLKGPCVTVQTACSTSLVALHLACQSLLNRECDLALAGGAALSIPQVTGYIYQESNKSSPDGHCRTFDARARGTVQSGGVALVLLKRVEDALRDGDSIYALVRGSAINNDGAAKVSYTAPSVDGQIEVIRNAQLLAGVSADSIAYVECHGTATEVGDPIEVLALTQAFRMSTTREQFCAVGSLKSNLGHMDAAAGAAGFIKAALALHHERVPPSLHFEQPNEHITFQGSPFFVNTELRSWPRSNRPRRAAVSAFGVGGTNAHVILEEAPEIAPSEPAPSWQLLQLSAKTESALDRATERLCAHLRADPTLNLADVAHTLRVGRKSFALRRFAVCRDSSDAVACFGQPSPQRVFNKRADRERPVICLFPGQGPHYPGMGSELYLREPVFRDAIDRCARSVDRELCDIAAAFSSNGRSPQVQQTTDQAPPQAVLFAFEYALAQLWLAWGVKPYAYLGHSMGEYVAATLAGTFELDDALRLIAKRERLLRALPPGAVLTVMLRKGQKLPTLAGDVAITACNGPSLYSLSGSIRHIESVESELMARDIVHSRLPVSLVSHCPHVASIVPAFRELFAGVTLRAPHTPFLSNVSGGWARGEDVTDAEYWVRHLGEPVRFSESVELLLRDLDAIWLEVGPGRALVSLVHQHEHGDEKVVVASLPHASPSQSEAELMLQALGKLWASGAQTDKTARQGMSRRLRVALPTYPFERQRCWVEAPRRPAAESTPAVARTARSDDPRPRAPAPANAPVISESQLQIMEFWQELLGVPRIELHHDFFDLGGNSLLGIQLHTRIKERFNVDISLKALLERTTVLAMDELVQLTILEEIESLQE